MRKDSEERIQGEEGKDSEARKERTARKWLQGKCGEGWKDFLIRS